MKEIYIVGAGVSGLIAAYELEQAGYQPIIIEQSSGVGGRVKTIEVNGYQLDLGFQVLLSAYPLANQYLDMEKLQLNKLESGAMIYADNKSFTIGDPMRNWKLMLPTLTADVGSIADKLKILKLNRKLKQKSLEQIFSTSEKTTSDYLKDFGFSSKIIERFFKPFFAGIFLEPDLSTSSRMFEFVYKMFGEGYATIPKLGIGEIPKQLKSKLRHTKFMFNTEVKAVTNENILLQSGDQLSHRGVIVTSNASKLITDLNQKEIKWKECMCLYFEVDQTNIPSNTIALFSQPDCYSNNLYAYKDDSTGKTILSVTTLKHNIGDNKNIIDSIISEVTQYAGVTQANYIHHFTIKQALPDIQNLKMSTEPKESQVSDNIFLAGDFLFNGSLNAAMESGRLAALGLVEGRAVV
jgi:protoporphyrinogen oxidase